MSDTLEDLIAGYFSDVLTPAQQQELAKLLDESQGARDQFAQAMRVEGSILALGDAGALFASEDLPALLPDQPDHSGRRRMLELLPVIVASLLIGWSLGLWSRDDSLHPLPPRAVAELVSAVEAEWQQQSFEVGQELPPSHLKLAHGIVEIEFHSGATVIVEGPAEFEIESDMSGYLHAGKARTVVPPQAYGFAMKSPDVNLEQGREFGLQVDPAGIGEVHVFEGGVQLRTVSYRSPASSRQLLMAGQAVRFDKSVGFSDDIEFDRNAFIDRVALDLRAEAYIATLESQLDTLRDQRGQVNRDLAEAAREARKSPDLDKLRSTAAKARWEYNQAANADRNIQEAERKHLRAKQAYDELIENRLASDEASTTTQQRIAEVRRSFDEIRRQLRDAKREKRPLELRRLSRELHSLSRERDKLEPAYRKQRASLRQRDPHVRALLKEYVAARRRVDQLSKQANIEEFARRANTARQRLLERQSELLADHPEISKLRDQRSRLEEKFKYCRDEIRRARRLVNFIEEVNPDDAI